MQIGVKIFITFFILTLTVLCFLPNITWAAPATYQEAVDLREAEKVAPPSVNIELPQMEYDAGNLRDPFEPEPFEEEEGKEFNITEVSPRMPLPSLEVKGIVWGAELPQAIINNRVVKIGDRIEGACIVDISKEGITVFHGGRQQLIAAPAVNMLEEQTPNFQGGTDETMD